MADVNYQCAVNKMHTKRLPGNVSGPGPYCCGKLMVKVQEPAAASAPKPQGYGQGAQKK